MLVRLSAYEKTENTCKSTSQPVAWHWGTRTNGMDKNTQNQTLGEFVKTSLPIPICVCALAHLYLRLALASGLSTSLWCRGGSYDSQALGEPAHVCILYLERGRMSVDEIWMSVEKSVWYNGSFPYPEACQFLSPSTQQPMKQWLINITQGLTPQGFCKSRNTLLFQFVNTHILISQIWQRYGVRISWSNNSLKLCVEAPMSDSLQSSLTLCDSVVLRACVSVTILLLMLRRCLTEPHMENSHYSFTWLHLIFLLCHRSGQSAPFA